MNKMTKTQHEEMRLAQEAECLRGQRNAKGTKRRFYQALLDERRVRRVLTAKRVFEPWRSLLHRSAAVMAIECGEFREAERLIMLSLAGNPAPAMADELRELLGRVYFERPWRRPRRKRPAAKS